MPLNGLHYARSPFLFSIIDPNILKMKRHILILFSVLISVFSFGQSDLVPTQNSYVDDYANVIDPASALSIDHKIREFKEKSTAEICVVTVNSLNNKDIADFSG